MDLLFNLLNQLNFFNALLLNVCQMIYNIFYIGMRTNNLCEYNIDN